MGIVIPLRRPECRRIDWPVAGWWLGAALFSLSFWAALLAAALS